MQENTKKALWVTIVLLAVAIVLVITGFVQKGNVQRQLDEALVANEGLTAQVADKDALSQQIIEISAQLDVAQAEVDAAKAESESLKASLEDNISTLRAEADALTQERDQLSATLEASVSAEAAQAQMDEANARIAALEESLTSAQTDAQAALEARDQLNEQLTQQAQDLELQLEQKEQELNAQITALTQEKDSLKADLDGALLTAQAAPQLKQGLGLVSTVGSATPSGLDRAAVATLNTTIASLVLDTEGRILSLNWDVQQIVLPLAPADGPLAVMEEELERLAQEQSSLRYGADWAPALSALEASAIGKTLEEALVLDTEGLPGAADLMEALRRAGDNAQ